MSGIGEGREKGNLGAKLKLNPVSYKEVTGGRFGLPIRNSTGSQPLTEDSDSENTSLVPQTVSSSHCYLPPPPFSCPWEGGPGTLCGAAGDSRGGCG